MHRLRTGRGGASHSLSTSYPQTVDNYAHVVTREYAPLAPAARCDVRAVGDNERAGTAVVVLSLSS